MADPRDIDPFEDDPYDSSINANILNFANDQNPTLDDLQSTAEQPTAAARPPDYQQPVPAPPPVVGSRGRANPFENMGMVELLNHFSFVGHDHETGPSNIHAEGPSNPEEEYADMNFLNEVNSRILSIWPVTPVPFLCSCCQVLREILHFNDTSSRKLEIHGRLGLICHAIMEHKPIVNVDNTSPQYQMFDFCDKSPEEIKQFLLQYCLKQILEDYTLIPDPMSNFYDALCVGIDWFENLNTDGFFQLSPDNSEDDDIDQPVPESQIEPPEQPGQPEEPPRRPSLAAQRQRTGRMTVNDVWEYLHLPIAEASKKLNVCNTVLKKICRRSGLSRWPYRKIRSYERRIAALRATMNSSYGDTRARAEAEIERIQKELADFCAGIRI